MNRADVKHPVLRRILVATSVGAVLAVTSGCGSVDNVVAGPGSTLTPTATAPSGRSPSRLTIEVTAPGQPTKRYTLTCDPAGGDHPDATAACAALDAMDAPFARTRGDLACTQVYGGPQVATVTGTLAGGPVSANFTRTDGCAIDRWDQHAAVLVDRGDAR